MYNNKKKILIAIGIIIAILSIMGVSYALWTFTGVQKKKNLVQLDCFNVQFNEITGSNIQLLNAFPLTDSEGQELDPYKFSISNKCANYASYQVRIEIKEESKLDDEFLKVMLNQNTPKLLKTENYANSDVLLGDNTNKAYIIETGYLNVNETKDFDLRLWLDESVTTDTRNKDGTNIQKTRWSGIVTISSSYAEETEIPVTPPKLIDVVKNTETVESEDGLYKVTHGDLTSEEGGIPAEDLNGWKQTEWRYAGKDPNNYVWFNCKAGETSGENNCEKWRIIGLVNVKVKDGENEKIEQRIKIIRDESIGNYSWDHKSSGIGSSTSTYGSNDWTDSQLMEMLNGIYYNSQSGECWTGSSDSSSSKSTCNFTQTSSGVKGLNETARDMIDKEIIWNLGGTASYTSSSNGLVTHWYGYERGTTVSSDRPTEWSSSNTKTSAGVSNSSLFRSIALPYPSDYGYATSGGSTGRETCFTKELYSWDNMKDCGNNDWLKPASGYMWTLSPASSDSSVVFFVRPDGYVHRYYAYGPFGVWPALYLNPDVVVTNSDVSEGTSDHPYELSLE